MTWAFYAPSDFLATFESAIAEQAVTPATLTIAGSAAEVAAELVAGRLDLGLIHLPAWARSPALPHPAVEQVVEQLAARFNPS